MKCLIFLCFIGSIFATSSCKKSSNSSVTTSYQLLDTGYYTVTSGSITINSININTYSPANASILVHQAIVNGVKQFVLTVVPGAQSANQLTYWSLSLTNPTIQIASIFRVTETYAGVNGAYSATNNGSISIADYNNSNPGVLLNASLSTTITQPNSTTNKETATINLQLTKM